MRHVGESRPRLREVRVIGYPGNCGLHVLDEFIVGILEKEPYCCLYYYIYHLLYHLVDALVA